ncbi:MAG: Ribose-phosphate pyrophosphokinase [Candidatus Magasanikbacteria bacterium GW2011_GWE2_42_7]|uniref:ribose-phosphate diphosphokinase n=1 Tax=Candidatus Magasanikbacteria bacterium GW2011_GWE2_42_7 TaxID=1619052 RepID=A0A0G1DIA5_9BACT|nr:MAG: Ribose-phosphate pyrophosphokinase [Candidatus Magasanikbacteria bacterium GW2011_GWE2_42_7]
MANGDIMIGYNRNGGLTLVPMPGFEKQAARVASLIVEKNTPCDIAEPKFGERTNGEPYLKLPKGHIGGHDCVILTSGPGTYNMLGQLYIMLAYLVGRRASRISIVSGYFPLSRSDKDEGADELALVSHTTRMMSSASEGKLDRIISADLHAPQVVMAGRMGLITEISLMRRLLTKILDSAGDRKLCLMFPDDGANKRFGGIVRNMLDERGVNLPIVVIGKRRSDSNNVKIDSVFGDAEDLRGSTTVIVDDETATMGTQIATAEEIRRRYGVEHIWAATVHGVLCGPAPGRLASGPIDRLYITDTIPVADRHELKGLVENGRLVVAPWEDDLANIIRCHHWDQSIRELR